MIGDPFIGGHIHQIRQELAATDMLLAEKIDEVIAWGEALEKRVAALEARLEAQADYEREQGERQESADNHAAEWAQAMRGRN
jgi:hypothetical protein